MFCNLWSESLLTRILEFAYLTQWVSLGNLHCIGPSTTFWMMIPQVCVGYPFCIQKWYVCCELVKVHYLQDILPLQFVMPVVLDNLCIYAFLKGIRALYLIRVSFETKLKTIFNEEIFLPYTFVIQMFFDDYHLFCCEMRWVLLCHSIRGVDWLTTFIAIVHYSFTSKITINIS